MARRGYHLSSAARQRISSRLKGRKLSASARSKISASLRGRHLSASARAKISAALKGKHHPMSAATRAKISAALKGKKRPHRGHPMSSAAKAKLSASLKAYWASHKQAKKATHRTLSAAARAKLSARMKGRHLSSAAKQKLSAELKGRKRGTPSRRSTTTKRVTHPSARRKSLAAHPRRHHVGTATTHRHRRVGLPRSVHHGHRPGYSSRKSLIRATHRRSHKGFIHHARRHHSRIRIRRHVRANHVWKRRRR